MRTAGLGLLLADEAGRYIFGGRDPADVDVVNLLASGS
jgi:hypothetical protein